MKIVITYKNGTQIGPDEYANWTEVICVNAQETLADVYEKHFGKKRWVGDVHVELHFLEEK